MKNVTVLYEWDEILAGYDVEGAPHVEVVEDGVKVSFSGHGTRPLEDGWYTSRDLKEKGKLCPHTISNLPKRPITDHERYAYGGRFHYMYYLKRD